MLRDLTIGAGFLSAIQAMAGRLTWSERGRRARRQGEIKRSVTAFARSSNGGMIVTASTSALVHRNLITGARGSARIAGGLRLPLHGHRWHLPIPWA